MGRPRLTEPRSCKDCGMVREDAAFRDANDTSHRACHDCRLPAESARKKNWYNASKAAKAYQRAYRKAHSAEKREISRRYRLRRAQEHWRAAGHALRRGEGGCRTCAAQAKVAA